MNPPSETLILKDGSVRSIWIYLTASPCCTTNTNKHDCTTNRNYKHIFGNLSCFARFRTVNPFTGSNVCIFGRVSSQEQSQVKVKLSRVAASENFACCKNLHGPGIPARSCATEISLPVMS